MIFDSIKIMLGKSECGPYDSYLEDMQDSGNKSRPKIEDHKLIAKIVRMLRGDAAPDALPASPVDDGPQKPVEQGIVDKLRKIID